MPSRVQDRAQQKIKSCKVLIMEIFQQVLPIGSGRLLECSNCRKLIKRRCPNSWLVLACSSSSLFSKVHTRLRFSQLTPRVYGWSMLMLSRTSIQISLVSCASRHPCHLLKCSRLKNLRRDLQILGNLYTSPSFCVFLSFFVGHSLSFSSRPWQPASVYGSILIAECLHNSARSDSCRTLRRFIAFIVFRLLHRTFTAILDQCINSAPIVICCDIYCLLLHFDGRSFRTTAMFRTAWYWVNNMPKKWRLDEGAIFCIFISSSNIFNCWTSDFVKGSH